MSVWCAFACARWLIWAHKHNHKHTQYAKDKETIAIMMYSELAPVMWTVQTTTAWALCFFFLLWLSTVSCWLFLCHVLFIFLLISSVVFLVIIAFLFSFRPIFVVVYFNFSTRYCERNTHKTFEFKLFIFYIRSLDVDCIVCNVFRLDTQISASKWMFLLMIFAKLNYCFADISGFELIYFVPTLSRSLSNIRFYFTLFPSHHCYNMQLQ